MSGRKYKDYGFELGAGSVFEAGRMAAALHTVTIDLIYKNCRGYRGASILSLYAAQISKTFSC